MEDEIKESKENHFNNIDTKIFPYILSEYINPSNFNNLVKAIGVLCFDAGIDTIYPPEEVDDLTQKNLTFLAFPESNLQKEQENNDKPINNVFLQDKIETEYTYYIFKIRQSHNVRIQCSSLNDQKFYYCYTLFMQKKSVEYKRGYMQKSLIILSEVYYKKLFINFLDEFRQAYEMQSCFLKNVKIQSKTDNSSYEEFSIKDLGTLYTNFNQMNQNKLNEYKISIYPQDNNFFENLSLYFVCKIWNLWELMITETPLIVQTETVNQSCSIVFLLSSLTFPLKFCGDLRPYFTIYESDYDDYKLNQNSTTMNSILIGAINPILLKSFPEIPVLHFDDFFYNGKNPTKGYFSQGELEEKLKLPNYNKKFLIMPNKTLIKTFYEFITQLNYPDNADQYETSLNKMNIYLRMLLIELNNDFMRTFEEYFFVQEKSNLKRISLIKPYFSIFEIFVEEKFFLYLHSKVNYFDSKYVKDKKKTSELYKRFIKTKCFNLYLSSLIPRIKNLKF